jgi:hypothetical protein
MKIDDIPDDITKEQFEEGMFRLELYKESHKRLCEWLEFHTQLFQSEDRHPIVIANTAIQMLSGMLVRGLHFKRVRPAEAAEEIARMLAEEYERNK